MARRPFEEADEVGRLGSMPPTHNSRGRGRPLLAAAGTLLEVISAEPPKIFFDGFGMELPEGPIGNIPNATCCTTCPDRWGACGRDRTNEQEVDLWPLIFQHRI